jgi:hypothetical protein
MKKKEIIELLENFLSEMNVEGICGGWVDEETGEDGVFWVYIILDLDWINEIPTKPEFIASRMRLGVAEEIYNFLDIRVRVGSVARKCEK